MATFRQSRFVAAFIAMFSMFFMQLAVAGYVCPELEPVMVINMASTVVEAGDESISNCHEMDIEQPNLCSAHAQLGDQSLDEYEVPPVQPFVAGFLANVVLPIEPRDFSIVALAGRGVLERTTAPPASIRNCCFRI
jgi:hypothetical protein